MSIVNAIIFDLDGVLVNTIDLHNHAWRMVAQAGGRRLSDADLEDLRGLRRNEGLNILFPHENLTPERIAFYVQIKHKTYTEALVKRQPDQILMKHALHVLSSARDAGLKLGIASSSMNARRVLDHAGLTPLFDAIADGGTVIRSKPQPDIFVWVAGALGVNPGQALVFEDSLAGLQGAKQAGMITVGVHNPEAQPLADFYFPNLSDIAIDDLLYELKQGVSEPTT